MSTVKARKRHAKLAPEDSAASNGEVKVVTPATNGSVTARLSKSRAPKPTHPCVCGCGAPTKRVFAQGHDAKVYAILRRVRDGEAKQSDVPKLVVADRALLAHMLAHVS